MTEKFIFEPLEKSHNREAFQNPYPALITFLQKQARQEMAKNISVTYVLKKPDSNQIMGYYSLSSYSILFNDLPQQMIKKLPKYPLIPAILIGRLAVDNRYQGKGLGQLLLVNALQRAFSHSQSVGAYAVVVDAKDEKAKGFYLKYGFIEIHKCNQLFLPMKTIEKLCTG